MLIPIYPSSIDEIFFNKILPLPKNCTLPTYSGLLTLAGLVMNLDMIDENPIWNPSFDDSYHLRHKGTFEAF